MFSIRTAEIEQGIAVKFVAFSAGLIMTGSFALGFVLFVWLYRRLGLRLTQRRALWMVPALWVVTEYVRAIIFSVVSMGPGGRIGPYWTFGNIGYLMAETPFGFAARFGGLYLLTGIAALLFVAGYQSWKKRDPLPILIVVFVAGLLSFAGYHSYKTASGPTRTIGTVRYAYKQEATQYSNESYSILEQVPDDSLDILVLPEYSHYFEEARDEDIPRVQRIMRRDDGLVIHSAREDIQSLGHNMLTFQAPDGQVLNQQEKWFVVPAGEYVPYIYQVILAYAGQERLLLDFNNQKSVNRGETVESPYVFDGVSYGAHACSGVIAPEFYNQLAQAGADVFSNSAALDTMGVSPLFHIESQNMNRLAAIAHAKPFIQGAKGGPAYIIDHNGQLVGKNYELGGGVVIGDVQTNTTKTLYTYLGDWIVYLSIIGLGAYLIHRKVTHKKVKKV
jgi:apolipoprotein N-acyltransferase